MYCTAQFQVDIVISNMFVRTLKLIASMMGAFFEAFGLPYVG